MFKVMIAALIFVSSSALAGIIGVGGTNASENPELLDRLLKTENLPINRPDFRRLSVRIDNTGFVNQEVTTTSGRRIRKDFIKVFHDHQEKIVDTDVTVNLEPVGPMGQKSPAP